MIKECEVILKNSAVVVVLFDGKEVQLPYDKQVTSTAYVKFEKNKHTIVSKAEYEKSLKPPVRNKEKRDSIDVIEEAAVE